MKFDLSQVCGHCWVFQIYWHIECSTFTASSFRICNSSTGIPSPPLGLFVVMLSKAHLASYSRMSGSRWVITPFLVLCIAFPSYVISTNKSLRSLLSFPSTTAILPFDLLLHFSPGVLYFTEVYSHPKIWSTSMFLILSPRGSRNFVYRLFLYSLEVFYLLY